MIYSAVIVNIEDTDGSKGLLKLSGKNKLSQVMVLKYLFLNLFINVVHYIILIHSIMFRYHR